MKAFTKLPIEELKNIAKNIRKEILKMLAEAGSGHTGGSLGLADIFTTLYFEILNHNPKNPTWEKRDRLILSIGHVAPVLYATLAMAGYFKISELKTLRKLGSRLQGHPAKNYGLPGIETSSGSLGQGLSIAVGLALAAKIDKQKWQTYCIMGDGEQQEGSIWEAAMSAAHYKLNNLTAIIDRNGLQIDGKTSQVMEIEPLANKWKAFNWNVIQCNGHDYIDIITALQKAKKYIKGPSIIIAKTIMGKGVKSIENDHTWHGKAPSKEELKKFLIELEYNNN
ncbi:MAG TPA: transketolase [Bacteroidales bacterium]|nr:transketolase [Bacteroidales bacterium]